MRDIPQRAHRPGRLELTLDFIARVSWPGIVLVLLLTFKGPAISAIGRATQVTWKDLSVQLGERARDEKYGRFGKILSSLTSQQKLVLLTGGFRVPTVNADQPLFTYLAALRDKGLVVYSNPSPGEYHTSITADGDSVVAVMLDLLKN